MQVCVLTPNGAFDTGLSSVLDTLQTANELGRTGAPEQTFEVLRRCAGGALGWPASDH